MRQFKFRIIEPGLAEIFVGEQRAGRVRKESDGWHGFGINGEEAPRVRATRSEAGSEVYALFMKSVGRRLG